MFSICFPAPAPAQMRTGDRFPFVIPGGDASAGTATDLSYLSPQAAGEDGFVQVVDGRLHTRSGRLRLWGMNLCFGANFPTHRDARRVAAHLAKLGINAVRIHHHDLQDAPSGIWRAGLVDGERVFDEEMVDRLDYFLAKLHEHGIYADLNLHCSRQLRPEEGFPDHSGSGAMLFNKYVLYFEPRMREELKKFCREFLLHKNPYRGGRARAEDPGVALMELTNENSFSMRGSEPAANLPDPYRSEFARQWNRWLAQRYGDDASLLRAWGDRSEPLGEPLASSDGWATGASGFQWHALGGSEMAVNLDAAGPHADMPAVQLDIIKAAGQAWEQQFQAMDLSLQEGRLYTLRFYHRAEVARRFGVEVAIQHPLPWEDLGGTAQIDSSSEWQLHTQVFEASRSADRQVRLCFNLGGAPHDVWLAGLSLRPGGRRAALPDGGTLAAGTIGIPAGERWGREALDDVRAFMQEVELDFTNEMLEFLREELGVRVPISSTQVNYHGWEVAAQTGSDFADVHSYWHHPLFPGRPWDPVDWTIQNVALETKPLRNTWPENSILMRSAWRLLDRPFAYSEWNSGEPMRYGASLVTTAAIVGALQDFDAVFFFQYDQGNQGWYRDMINDFFSFNGQPAKLAMVCAAANLFRRGDLAPLTEPAPGSRYEAPHGGLALSHRLGVDPLRAEPPMPFTGDRERPLLRSPGDAVVWDARDPARAHVRVDTPNTRMLTGFVGGRRFELGDLSVTVGHCPDNYACIVVTSLDGQPLAASQRMLVSVVGWAENTDMVWNADRTSVGDRWGTGPTTMSRIPVKLGGQAVRGARAWVLDGTGKRLVEGSIDGLGVKPAQASAFYELLRN